MTNRLLISYHNHTNASDGAATLEEMIEGARAAGLDELGISDHYVLTPDSREVNWSIGEDGLDSYVASLEQAAKECRGLTLRIGIEADFFPETAQATLDVLAQYPFDYIIGSVHFVDTFPIDSDRKHWDALDVAGVDAMWQRYWERMRQMAEAHFGDFVGHLDLPKKYGHRPSRPLIDQQTAALDALAAAGMALEINTAGWSLAANEAYPSLELLTGARERGIPLIINADAHSPAHLARDFDRARDLARQAGYTETVRYEKRRRIPEPLA